MSYEILGHTADIKFRATGETLSEAFEGATRAFGEIVAQDETPEADDVTGVEVEAEDVEALLFDYLARLIYVQDVEGVVVVDGDCDATAEPPRVEATLRVAPNEGGLLDIKAPTYNEMVVEETDDGWTLEAVLDI